MLTDQTSTRPFKKVTFVVPTSGLYDIHAHVAQSNPVRSPGDGRGAQEEVNFLLTAPQGLTVIVGGQSGGATGDSFVTVPGLSAIVDAGFTARASRHAHVRHVSAVQTW